MLKKTLFFKFNLLFVSALLLQNSFAQDYTQFSLPEGAKARFGKGRIYGNIAYSPDGTRLAVASAIGIWIYDMSTGAEVTLLTRETGLVTSVAYSPDGSTLVSGGWHKIQLWDVRTGGVMHTLEGHPGTTARALAYSPDGSTLASGGGYAGRIRLWDARTGELKDTLEGHPSSINSMAYSPDGNTLASGSWDSTIRLWDTRTGELKDALEGHTNGISSVAYSPDGNTLASGSWDSTIRLWDTRTGELKDTLEGHIFHIRSVMYSPDGNTLASGSWDSTIRLWDTRTGELKDTLEGHTDGISSVAYSPDGNTLASGSWDSTIRLWDTRTGELKDTLEGHIFDLRSVVYSPDGNTLASGSWDSTIRLWDTRTGELKDTLEGHTSAVNSVTYSPDGNTLASGSRDSTIRLWDTRTGELKNTLEGHTSAVNSVTYSPDGSTLASGSFDDTIRLWDTRTGELKDTLEGHTDGISSVAYSPDGSTLASGSFDDTIRLWNTRTGELKNTLEGHTRAVNSVAYSPDGSTLASGSFDDTIRLWNTRTGELKNTLEGHRILVTSVAYSPDGSTLASGSFDGTIRLWDTHTGKHQQTFRHQGGANSVAYSPDGGTLASGSGDGPGFMGESAGTILLWKVMSKANMFNIFDLVIPEGISLIHIPLKVTTVNEVSKTIESVGDLYDALGGTANVSVLITYNTQTQRWNSYLGDRYRGRPGDRTLTDGLGIIASMKALTSIRLSGAPLGTNGSSSITLQKGLNLVGVPLKDSRITKVSDLLALDGIRDNVSVIIGSDAGAFKLVTQAGDPGDVELTGGGSFIMTAREAATVAISGDGWANVSGPTAASPMALTGIQVAESTPVLAVTGSIVSPVDGASLLRPLGSGFRVTIKNLSTGKADTAVTDDDSVGYQLTFVELETGRAAQIGDTLEISAQSPNPLVGIQPLRYVITAEDVKRGHIQLGELVVYEIPAKTQLLPNYPNPFNPETWIPYRLAEDANVTLTIYDLSGGVVRRLNVGHRIAGVYESRDKAIYWDGRTEFGDRVASGIYFYHLSAGDYSATRKMVILK